MRCRTWLGLFTILAINYLSIPVTVNAEVNTQSFTFAVVPQQAIRKVARTWLPVTQYLEKKTGYKFHFATAKNIPEFAKKLSVGEYDFAYMNPYHYVTYSRDPGYKAFAMARDKKLKGIIVVRKDSKIKSLTELQDRTLAFPFPRAFGATVLSRTSLLKQHIVFNSVYVNSHDSVYQNIANGNYPAGGGVLRTFYAIDKNIMGQLRILHTSKGFTPHAFASHPDIPEDVVRNVQQALIEMESDERGITILTNMKLKGIKSASDPDWDDVRDLKLAD